MMKRFWEIDALRGFAVLLMLVFNYSFALSFLGIYKLSADWLYWWLFPRMIAGMFIFLVGISLSISISRKRKYNHYLKRGIFIFLLGMLATAATWLYLGSGFVVFGILHLIGLSIIIAPIFFKFNKWNFFIGLILLFFGFYINTIKMDFSWLLWLGLVPQGFYTVDYFPLLPWFGLVLIGFAIGNNFYYNGKRNFEIKDLSKTNIIKKLAFLGRHSLLIYVLHQPLLIILLAFLGII